MLCLGIYIHSVIVVNSFLDRSQVMCDIDEFYVASCSSMSLAPLDWKGVSLKMDLALF